MFAFKEKFPDWKDFPNGLRVLVVDEDTKVLNEIKCKLEGCQYVVSAFTKGEDALEALRDQQNIFHVALVEAMTGEGFKILEVARHLPTILMSNTENMAIMMQGIALGAADFLQKPLSDEKLRNIWQHVVRKALNTGDPLLMESLVPVKAAVESVFSLSPSPGRVKAEPVSSPGSDGESKSKDMEWVAGVTKSPSSGDAAVCERLPAPSTPQLEQTGRMNSQEDSVSESPGSDSFVQVKTEGEDPEPDAAAGKPAPCTEVKVEDHVEAVSESSQLDIKLEDYPTVIKLELDDNIDDIGLSNGIVVDGDGGSGLDINPCLLVPLPESALDMHMNIEALDAGEVHDTEIGEEEALLLAEVAKAGAEGLERTPSMNCLSVDSGDCSSGEKKGEGCKVNNKATSGRRKMKVDWTPELHRRFVQAVEQLGVEKAIPSRILELMGVQCLTRHNIASHLQKYRSHRRHLLAREAEAATWHHRKPIDPNVWARSRRDGTAWLAPHHTNPPPIQPRPPMGLTPIQPHPGAHCHPMGPPMHVWGHPTMDHTAAHMWQQPQMATPTTWQAPDGSYWQHPCIDAWGHPTPGPGTPCYPQPYRVPMAPMPAFASPMTTAALAADSYFADESMPIPMYPTAPDDPELTVAAGAAASSKPSDFHPPKEILDAAISEALANPWTPLPLGLKPPSMEGVMAELQRQGINTVPPPPLTS
ncbi:protein MpGARP8 [Marchantia polymorpha subsp. ruderalis]|uniref:Two-component response regulator-like APRR2 n=2 Tax=Marchantia polymorpha TaxID=3197 RepID=A0A176WS14_MARPO|nr:hypothetical protein AXG93_4259s1030 [Marchantia polymorpha subsp. ruderalis]PTQ28706.1 hypothetical protein MARPO_0156s0007 [Marchantia polymorpha]BBN16842.1 hypothetical protein Mp_7g09740 [Marchantia polymorpha subsp. ruderalis]|eukprot:PTQ28706.1 hypothetical protein MARPO_0156s0007 [Marchantia polymorpha]